MSIAKNRACRCDWCGKLSRNQFGEYTRPDGVSAGYIHGPDWDREGPLDICEECADRLSPYRLHVTEEVLNVARCVLQYTEVVRRHNGRGRCSTYAADVDAIVGSARHLATLVLAFGEATLSPERIGGAEVDRDFPEPVAVDIDLDRGAGQ